MGRRLTKTRRALRAGVREGVDMFGPLLAPRSWEPAATLVAHRDLTAAFALLVLVVGSSPAGQAGTKEVARSTDTSGQPTSADPRIVVELFASAPDIVHPIGMDMDSRGRLLVVESHTHFRPVGYGGPPHDRIRMLEDTDEDGKADRITTFHEGTTGTIDLALHPDGSVYVATRNRILRLRDDDDDGRADRQTRVVLLETETTYPHNGLCGLSFDFRGDLRFGLGENLGLPYQLSTADGTTLRGGGEGGGFFRCGADGVGLSRVATGLWNPFGSCRDGLGRFFVVDGDPDASPPCRLLHIVDGGNYGYQYRYGRSGSHPFQAWNGELPGTLPMAAATGESPCEVISYESDGLPPEYRGSLLVTAWADHRLEAYTLEPSGASYRAERRVLVQGNRNFRPCGLALAPDGSLFIGDWVTQSYELRGRGAIWHVRWRDSAIADRSHDPRRILLEAHRPSREAAARLMAKEEEGRAFLRQQLGSPQAFVRASALAALVDVGDDLVDLESVMSTDEDVGLRAMAVRAMVARGRSMSTDQLALPAAVRAEAILGAEVERAVERLLDLSADPDPFLRHAATRRLAQAPQRIARIDPRSMIEPARRTGLLLASRASGEMGTAAVLAIYLAEEDPDLRFLAIQWIADEKLEPARSLIARALLRPDLAPREFMALATAQARLDDEPVDEERMAGRLLATLLDPDTPIPSRLRALRAIPTRFFEASLDTRIALLGVDDPALRVEVMRVLQERPDAAVVPALIMIAGDEGQPPSAGNGRRRCVARLPGGPGRTGSRPQGLRAPEIGDLLPLPRCRWPRGGHRPGSEPRRSQRAPSDPGVDPAPERVDGSPLSAVEGGNDRRAFSCRSLDRYDLRHGGVPRGRGDTLPGLRACSERGHRVGNIDHAGRAPRPADSPRGA
jgi:putative membrane-bound dehydrogenase-like protein